MKAAIAGNPAGKPSRRTNIYLRSPMIFAAFMACVEKKLITARSASERLEQLVKNDVRRLAPKMKKAGIIVPPEVFEK